MASRRSGSSSKRSSVRRNSPTTSSSSAWIGPQGGGEMTKGVMSRKSRQGQPDEVARAELTPEGTFPADEGHVSLGEGLT